MSTIGAFYRDLSRVWKPFSDDFIRTLYRDSKWNMFKSVMRHWFGRFFSRIFEFPERVWVSYRLLRWQKLDLLKTDYFLLLDDAMATRDAMSENGHIDEYDPERMKRQQAEYDACLSDAHNLYYCQFAKGLKTMNDALQEQERLEREGMSYRMRMKSDRLTESERAWRDKLKELK